MAILQLVDRCVHGMEVSELPGAGKLDRVDEVRNAASLRSRLKNASRAPDGIGQTLGQFDRDGARFLAIDVFARFGRQHRGGRVPTVARGD